MRCSSTPPAPTSAAAPGAPTCAPGSRTRPSIAPPSTGLPPPPRSSSCSSTSSGRRSSPAPSRTTALSAAPSATPLSIDSQVHHPAVHRGHGRAGGAAGGAEHVRRGEGADVRFRVPPRRPDGHRRAGPRRGRRLRALAEDARGLVLRAHNGRPQDERRQRRQGRVAAVCRRALPRLARPAPPPPPLSPGPGSTLHREPLLRRGVHRREDPQQRGVLHPEAGGWRRDAAGAERSGVRHHPPHGLGLLQPAHGAAHPARRLAPAPHEVRQGRSPQREHLLGDQHGVRHLRLPLHRRHQHRARRPHQRHALPLRRGIRQPQAEAGGDMDGGGGRFQRARPHHGLLPAAGRPQEGRRGSQ
uniref:Uncharacterized protein n=1 Tax=Zea mays TaxID=4577 RepID=A0A804R1E6_MAIZE